jgi:diguanylate cyclase (GGDEF)-like protein
MFVFDPLIIVLLDLLTLAVFSFLTLWYKAYLFARVDIVNAAVSLLAGITLNWHIAHILVGRIILTQKIEHERNHFREESVKDELTGLSNRRDYQHAVGFYISVCRHVHQTVCALMMDVDFFKKYNDHYGHPQGDVVLQSIGGILRQLMEEESIFAARVGGEEFIILWTENRIAEAERVALKLRQMIIDLAIPHEQSAVAPYVTASIGLYVLRGGAGDTAEEFYSNADLALYEAKKNGRNCIVLHDSEDKSFRMVNLLPPEENIGRR